ncbi:hypothetical protein [Streptomyces sp. NRRL S-340]|uniref:hypothetical protein n=1 Tax=Streptomyces sp. NRRL S-340 TaxID=1463901 RepID=UPI00056CE62F|nr:hypothetical protein [Streptomyces sp. NRRL S-340]
MHKALLGQAPQAWEISCELIGGLQGEDVAAGVPQRGRRRLLPRVSQPPPHCHFRAVFLELLRVVTTTGTAWLQSEP